MSKLFNETFGAGDGKRLDVIPWLRFGQNEETRRLEKALGIRDCLWDSLVKRHRRVNLEEKRDISMCFLSHCLFINTLISLWQFSEKSVIGHLQSLKGEGSDIDDNTIKECFTNLILAGI